MATTSDGGIFWLPITWHVLVGHRVKKGVRYDIQYGVLIILALPLRDCGLLDC